MRPAEPPRSHRKSGRASRPSLACAAYRWFCRLGGAPGKQWFVMALSALGCARGAGPGAVHPRQFHLFLLAGQSNMAGRGEIDEQDREPLAQVLSLDREGNWRPARDPIHWDKPSAGVGLARSFAKRYLEQHPGVTVGLIPAACGGSPISTWEPGQFFKDTASHPYDDALTRARRAMTEGELKAILWHQGESDRAPELAGRYEVRLTQLIERFRADLRAPRLPFIIGQLGRFPGAPWDEGAEQIDRAHRAVAAQVPGTAFVSAAGLGSKGDDLHFNSRSLRVFGERYADALHSLQALPMAADEARASGAP